MNIANFKSALLQIGLFNSARLCNHLGLIKKTAVDITPAESLTKIKKFLTTAIKHLTETVSPHSEVDAKYSRSYVGLDIFPHIPVSYKFVVSTDLLTPEELQDIDPVQAKAFRRFFLLVNGTANFTGNSTYNYMLTHVNYGNNAPTIQQVAYHSLFAKHIRNLPPGFERDLYGFPTMHSDVLSPDELNALLGIIPKCHDNHNADPRAENPTYRIAMASEGPSSGMGFMTSEPIAILSSENFETLKGRFTRAAAQAANANGLNIQDVSVRSYFNLIRSNQHISQFQFRNRTLTSSCNGILSDIIVLDSTGNTDVSFLFATADFNKYIEGCDSRFSIENTLAHPRFEKLSNYTFGFLQDANTMQYAAPSDFIPSYMDLCVDAARDLGSSLGLTEEQCESFSNIFNNYCFSLSSYLQMYDGEYEGSAIRGSYSYRVASFIKVKIFDKEICLMFYTDRYSGVNYLPQDVKKFSVSATNKVDPQFNCDHWANRGNFDNLVRNIVLAGTGVMPNIYPQTVAPDVDVDAETGIRECILETL